ncbi:hypothetical protein [Methylobacterium sp. JK268]
MTTRTTALALALLGGATLAAPAQAQQTFKAWNFEFLVPGQPVAIPAPRRVEALPAPRTFTSSDGVLRGAAEPAPAEHRTLNVWGARIDVPTR